MFVIPGGTCRLPASAQSPPTVPVCAFCACPLATRYLPAACLLAVRIIRFHVVPSMKEKAVDTNVMTLNGMEKSG